MQLVNSVGRIGHAPSARQELFIRPIEDTTLSKVQEPVPPPVWRRLTCLTYEEFRSCMKKATHIEYSDLRNCARSAIVALPRLGLSPEGVRACR